MATYICQYCGYEGRVKRVKRGSKMLESFLWTVFLIPGPFYSVWRRSGVDKTCIMCGKAHAMVKVNSDAGWVAKRRLEVELGEARKSNPPAEMNDAPAPVATPAPKKRDVDPDVW